MRIMPTHRLPLVSDPARVPEPHRVDRHQHQPGQGGPVLQQDPLQRVARPHRHVLARPKPHQQRTGHPLGLAPQLRVAQPAPRPRTRRPLHHCGTVRHLRRCRTQRITDGLLHQGPRRVPTPVGQPLVDPAPAIRHHHPHSMRPHRRHRRDATGVELSTTTRTRSAPAGFAFFPRRGRSSTERQSPRGLIRVPERRNAVDRFSEAETVGEVTTEVAPCPRGVLAAMDRHGCDRTGLAAPGTALVRQR